jgi:copper transport protein
MTSVFNDLSFPLVISIIIIVVVGLILSQSSIPLYGVKKHLFPSFVLTKNEANSLSPTLALALSESPKLGQLIFHIQDFTIPDNNDSIPLYPLYDKNRNEIWVGDTAIDSSRILAFNLKSGKFMEHKLNGTSIVTVMAFDHNNTYIWYVDPLLKRLGHYDPSANTTKLYNIPTNGTISRIAIDLKNNVWLTSPNTNELLRFNTRETNFTVLNLPTTNAMPIGIAVDKSSGMIWVAEGIGKLASIDPIKNYKINEYPVLAVNNSNHNSKYYTNNSNTHYTPTELFIGPSANDGIYISEHDNHTVSIFNIISKTFKTYPVFNPKALPFGLAMDMSGYLWVAEHTTNKIAVIDPKTGSSREVVIPKPNPYVQFLTSDSQGNIWLAEQLGNSLGVITSSPTKTP